MAGHDNGKGTMIKKFDEIEKIIAEAANNKKAGEVSSTSRAGSTASPRLIRNILLLCTEYDYFILEEEGRLTSLFRKMYDHIGGNPPKIIKAENEKALLSILKTKDIDVLIMFKPPIEMDAFALARKVKDQKPDLPIVLVDNNTEDLDELVEANTGETIDWIFTWFGDGKIFLNITQFIEDQQNFGSDTPILPQRVLIIAESPRYYSNLLSEAYEAIWGQLNSILPEDMPSPLESRLRRRYPQVLIADSTKVAKTIFAENLDDILCVIIDIDQSNIEKNESLLYQFIERVVETKPSAPTLLLSSDSNWQSMSESSEIDFLQKGSPNYIGKIRNFIQDSLGSKDLSISDKDGAELIRIEDIKTFEKAIWTMPAPILLDHSHNNSLIRWLISRLEFELAHEFKTIISIEDEPEILRKNMTDAMEQHRRDLNKGVVSKYSRRTYGEHSRFCRIGKGAMGGKARGLAFMDKIISNYLENGLFRNLNISMPRTIVICSDIFDSFLEDNDLVNEELYFMSDERIAMKFMEADLPPILLGDLRAFVRETKVPIVVRSSSLLEDALNHPFAGVYSSLLLPNESWETDLRFQELCNAVKYVFASVFFQKARTYMETTPNTIEDEKMAVIIQELIGQKYGDVFYPTISGVTKSYEYYPSGSCKNTDGVVNLALGLGKAVVDGSSTFRFCPMHPKVHKYGTVKELLGQSQKKFYAVDLTSYVNIVQRDEDSALVKLDLTTAEEHGILDHTASTYSNERLYPGIGRDGSRVIDFAPIRELGIIPLPKAIHMLLQVGEIAIGTPVEIEFAVNIHPEPKRPVDLYLLQIRSMFSNVATQEVEIGQHDEKNIICYTENVLGNGIIDNIKDIVFVKPEGFELSKNQSIVPQIRKLNKKLMESKTPYILIGPGRWGSTDQWLGIPVTWSDIAGAKIIVETPVKERIIDPSQGSHFFHNMTSAHIGYFTITPFGKGTIDWDWLGELPTAEETENLKHIRFDTPLEVRIDGNHGLGVILKKLSKEVMEVAEDE